MNHKRVLIVALLAALLLAACGGASGGGGGAQSGGAGPADVAKQFMDNVYSGGDIAPLVCSAAASEVESMRDALAQVAASGATVDTSGLTYTVQNESGDTAEVAVGGTIKVTVAGAETEVPMTDMTIPMRNENGWKVCA